MADKYINELEEAGEFRDESLLAAYQQNETMKIPGRKLKEYLRGTLDEYVHDAGFLLQIGETVTGEAGSPAKVENTGTAEKPELRFTLPQGVKGDKGDPGGVVSVNGRDGAVELSKEDVGLDQVDNTPDNQKNVASAGKLAAKHTIGLSGGATGTPTGFDGTGDILIPVTALNPDQLSKVVPVSKGGTGNTSVDPAPVAGSSKMVTSGGVYDALRKAETSNILINWDFRSPWNQRGLTAYTSGYAIDRWRCNANKITVNSGYITLATAGQWQNMDQLIEDGGRFSGVPVTFSILYRTTSSSYRAVVRRDAGSTIGAVNLPASSGWNLVSVTVVPDNIKNFAVAIDCTAATAGTIDFQAAKLEVGRTQTLAHKDGNGWLINDGGIQDKTVEFLRCARYFFRQVIGSYCRIPCSGVAGTGTDGSRVYIHLPVPLRATPTITFHGELFLGSSNLIESNANCERKLTGVLWTSVDQNTCRFAPTTATGFPSLSTINWIGSRVEGNYIDFNAEL